VPWAPEGLVLDRPVPVDRLPGFREGQVSVQDAAAQLAAPLLDPRPRERILDACAAPGGKTAHLLELTDNQLDLTAIDNDEGRLRLVADTLDRLSLMARLQPGDAARPSGGWAAAPYDRILLDAPCSASGVIRRHPDIKWLRRDADIPALVSRQSQMLDALWGLLAQGGRLLYVTCSVLPEENERQVVAFLDRQPEAREVPIDAAWGIPRTVGRQILPSSGGSDGFYYAKLERRAA
jgi:16S rRNA (cytosine967-C5)-methyltransferase